MARRGLRPHVGVLYWTGRRAVPQAQGKDTGHRSGEEYPARSLWDAHVNAAKERQGQGRAAPGHTQRKQLMKSYPAFGPDRTTAPGRLIPRFCPKTMWQSGIFSQNRWGMGIDGCQ